MSAVLAAATQRLSVPNAIDRYLAAHPMMRLADLAKMLGYSNPFMGQIARGVRNLPEAAIRSLPDGLRQEVGEILARRHLGAAATICDQAGIELPQKQTASRLVRTEADIARGDAP